MEKPSQEITQTPPPPPSDSNSEKLSSSEEEVLFDGRQHKYSESNESANDPPTESDPEPEPEDLRTVPEKCKYCGVNRADELVKCLECDDWFCNTKTGRSASHAIFHMVKRKHKRLSKHPHSQFGELGFECFFCKNQNIFQLGLVPYVLDHQKTFLISCRKFFCTTRTTVSQFELEEDQWQSLILEKQLLDFLVTCSDRSMRLNDNLGLKVNDLNRFENQRIKGNEITIEEHQQQWRQEDATEIQRIPMSWPDEESYCRDFMFLVEKEMEEDQRQKEAVFFSGLELDWKKASRRKAKVLVVCKLPIFEEVDINSFTNQMIELSLSMKVFKEQNPFHKNRTREQIRQEFPDINLKIVSKKTKKPKDLPRPTPKPAVPEKKTYWSADGMVIRPYSMDEILIEISSRDIPEEITEGYDLRLKWKSITHDRFIDGLEMFADLDYPRLSRCLTENILGRICHSKKMENRVVQEELLHDIPNLPKLNFSQEEAIKKVLKRELSLLQGPPGTGKTITCAALVYYLIHETNDAYLSDAKKKGKSRFGKKKNNKDGKEGGKKRVNGKRILVCAPSNVVVDHLLSIISKTGVNVVQVCSRIKENLFELTEGDSGSQHTLHAKLRGKIKLSKNKVFQRLHEKREKESLSESEMGRYKRELRKLEKEIISHSDVVCCTCSSAFDSRLKKFHFDCLLVDEATQATEPEILLPMLKGPKQVILIGDHMQLGPVVLSKDAAQGGMNRSLFERMVKLGLRPVRLEVQYRMHPALSQFPSESYYEGKLMNGVAQNDRHFVDIISDTSSTSEPHKHDLIKFDWPAGNDPLFFWHIVGVEELSSSGTSYINSTEADMILLMLKHLLLQNVKLTSIGIITPYKGQRIFLQNYLSKSLDLGLAAMTQLEINSIDSFQGREKDFIILSTVRSSKTGGIGFLNNERRLNVALTRAKFGMVVLGNAKVLMQNHFWNNLLHHFSEKKLLFEGNSMDSLVRSTMTFEKKFSVERNQGDYNNKKRY